MNTYLPVLAHSINIVVALSISNGAVELIGSASSHNSSGNFEPIFVRFGGFLAIKKSLSIPTNPFHDKYGPIVIITIEVTTVTIAMNISIIMSIIYIITTTTTHTKTNIHLPCNRNLSKLVTLPPTSTPLADCEPCNALPRT